jgi:6-phospho-beta-glucosidase
MRRLCPQAWLINFANPAGMLAEAALQAGGWERVVGICDAPRSMARVAAAAIGAPPHEIYLDYFGLNHLGWIRSVLFKGRDHLPDLLETIRGLGGGIPGLPFDPQFLDSLGMIPNEYLYYYYESAQAVKNILSAGPSRGERIAAANQALLADLRRLRLEGDLAGMQAAYAAYLEQRGVTYMVNETQHAQSAHGLNPQAAGLVRAIQSGSEGYAGVALDLIEALSGSQPGTLIVNIANRGAIEGMHPDEVVEIPALVARDLVRPLAVGSIPSHCLGLMRMVKDYEQLTISAAVEGSYARALQALASHPLVRDRHAARQILDGYIQHHGAIFPPLS